MRIPTLIPQSVVDSASSILRGPLLETVWRLLVITGLLSLSAILLAAGGYGAVIGALLVGSLISDDVRQLIRDIWYRDFWVWRT